MFGVLDPVSCPLAFGLLRLSTEGRPPMGHAVKVIHRALDLGVRVLDTADSYARATNEAHYGERLAKTALDEWPGDKSEVKVITKVGLIRSGRQRGQLGWRPAGRREHILKTTEEGLSALGVDKHFMVLLHARDPMTPFEETLKALAEIQEQGLTEHVGLANVSTAEVRQAQGHFAVAALCNELSVMSRKSATTGVVALARELGVPFLAHRPLGGHAKVRNLLKNRAMRPLATKYNISPHQAALATLLDLGPPVMPIFGATKTASVEMSMMSRVVRLDKDDRAAREKISFRSTVEAQRALKIIAKPEFEAEMTPGEGPRDTPEIVMVMGIQGAGKSTHVRAYTDAGYARLNRDAEGGKLEDLIPKLDKYLSTGRKRVVLDNTYPSWTSRYPVIRAAHARKVPVRCLHMATPPDEALVNVTARVLERYGRLLSPFELAELGKRDPNLAPPRALERYAATFEAPSLSEGFSLIEEVPFARRAPPAEFDARGLLLDVDGTLRRTKSGENYPRHPDDIELLPNRREVLERYVAEGVKIFLVSNQSGIASGRVRDDVVQACFWRTVELLGVPVTEIRYCPHPAFPVQCFCRKPMPGFGLDLIARYQLSKRALTMVGDMDSDRRFAEILGIAYQDAADFFGSG